MYRQTNQINYNREKYIFLKLILKYLDMNQKGEDLTFVLHVGKEKKNLRNFS